MKKIFLVAAMTISILCGCDTSTNNDSEHTDVVTSGVLTGKLFLGNSSGTPSVTGATSAKVCMNGVCGNVSSDGTYIVATSAKVSTGISARVNSSDTILGTAYVVVDKDTLKEIPVVNWHLPTGYMVQRSFEIVSGKKMTGDSAQLVYWSSDSVAYVVTAAVDQGSSTLKYSGNIYNYYDSIAYSKNDVLFRYFVRTYSNSKMLAYSDVFGVTAKNGDFSVDSGKMHLTTYNRTGYSYVPALDTITRWIDSTELNVNYQWISLDSLKSYSSNSQFLEYRTTDTTYWLSVMSKSDSVKIVYDVVASSSDTSYSIYGFTPYLYNGGANLIVKSSKQKITRDTIVPMTVFGTKQMVWSALKVDSSYSFFGIQPSTNNESVQITNIHVSFHIKN